MKKETWKQIFQIVLTIRGHKTKRIFKREPENDGRT